MPMLWDRSELILATEQHIHRCARAARKNIDNATRPPQRQGVRLIDEQEFRALGAIDMLESIITLLPGNDPGTDLGDITRLRDLVHREFVRVDQEYTRALQQPM